MRLQSAWFSVKRPWLQFKLASSSNMLRGTARVSWDFSVQPPAVFFTPNLHSVLEQPRHWRPVRLQDLAEGARTERQEDAAVVQFLEDPLKLVNRKGRIDLEFVKQIEGQFHWYRLQVDTRVSDGMIRTANAHVAQIPALVRPQYDALTQVLVRQPFERKLELQLQYCSPHNMALFAMLDVNGFKRYNDILSYDAGDLVLIKLGDQLRRFAREIRELGCQADVGRWGGDEFMVLCYGITDLEKIAQIRGLLMDALSFDCQVTDLDGQKVSLAVQARAGFSPPLMGPTDTIMLKRQVNIALNAAKGERKNFSVYKPFTERIVREEMEIDGQLRQAMLSQDISPGYEPIIDLATGKVVRVEALARWWRLGRRGHRERVSPDTYLNRVGALNLLTEHDGLVALQAARAMKWLREERGITIDLSVNLAPESLEDSQVAENIESILASTGMEPANLVLELTEWPGLTEHGRPFQTLKALRALGCRLAIDDFGTGQSGLHRLRNLPFTDVKLDKSLIEGLTTHTGQATIVLKHLVAMFHELYITVTAEGIEEHAHLEFLRNLEVDLGQGYLFSTFTEGRERTIEHIAEYIDNYEINREYTLFNVASFDRTG